MGDCSLVALWGDEHETLGDIALATPDATTALALSRGRLAKAYDYIDPNEDAVLAATGQARRLLAAADGHNGFDAARAALEAIAGAAPALVAGGGDPEPALRQAFVTARVAITGTLVNATGRRRWSRTALSLVLCEGTRAWTATLGDTAVVRVRDDRATVVSEPGPFLGAGTPLPGVVRLDLDPRDHLLALTDGVVDYLGAGWRRQLGACVHAERTPEAAVRRIVEHAMEGGAGDNCAVAAAYPQNEG